MIEDTLNRIAVALEELTLAQKTIAEYAYAVHSCSHPDITKPAWVADIVQQEEDSQCHCVGGVCSFTPPEPAEKEEEADLEVAEEKPSYEDLKGILTARGVDVKKGTRYATLERLVRDLPDAPAVTEAPAEDIPDEPAVAEDPVGDIPVQAAPQVLALSVEAARNRIIAAGYEGTEDDVNRLYEVLQSFGARSLSDVPEEKREALCKAYEAAAGVTNA